MVLVPSATAGGVPLVLARLVEGLSTHQCAGGPWRLEDRRNCSQVSPCAGRLPSGRGPNADRPSMSWATSTARRIAAATWIMSSTTVASRAYAVVPAKRSRWSRGGAYRPRSAPAAGSARHRADAGRRDRAARSPDPQPASCRRSFRRGYPARAAPSTPHHWRPPDRQPVPGCVGRDVLAGACVPTSGPAGAVPVRVRSRSSAGLRWRRGRLWHPRRQHRPLRTGPGSGDRCEGRRFAPLARRIYVPGILSSEPSQVCPPAHGTVPERRANVQKGARPRGTDRRYSVPFRGSAGRRKDAGTCWLGCCPPELSTGETHPRAKRPMNRAKTSLRRRAAPKPVRIPHERHDRGRRPRTGCRCGIRYIGIGEPLASFGDFGVAGGQDTEGHCQSADRLAAQRRRSCSAFAKRRTPPTGSPPSRSHVNVACIRLPFAFRRAIAADAAAGRRAHRRHPGRRGARIPNGIPVPASSPRSRMSWSSARAFIG